MALNTNMPFGMKPLFMAEARKTALVFPVTNNYGTALYTQDPALGVTAGTIERGSTTGAILGIILGLYRQETPKSIRTERLIPVQYMAATPGTTYNYFALVTTDPDIMFLMQEDGVTSSLAITDNFGNCDIVLGTGNTTTGISGAMVDSNTVANTATLAVRLVFPAVNWYDIDAGQYNTPVATALNYGKWICKLNCPQLGATGSLSVGLA